MEGTILEVIQIECSLAAVETLTGELTDKRESTPIVDSAGNIPVDSEGDILVDCSPAEPLTGDLSGVSVITADLSMIDEIQADISTVDEITATISIPDSIGGLPYTGDYEVTPSQEVQVLNTQGKSMRHNVTINPIPSNYGLITWNGSTLTVS